ncbi:hypothetical protein [Haloplanus halophilus]|uniref:hypothetical protein n=1 Tax=Haloplanus halophilus TaxID=2949993 RepID=UPI00203F8891|nr:hypothetical protein [Haloplanus sp. GDY1]
MTGSDRPTTRPALALAASVFAATGSASLSSALLPALRDSLGVGAASAAVLVGAVSPFLHSLLPLAVVYAAGKRIGGFPVSAWTVAGVSLTAAVLGRYVGTGVGYALGGRPLPTPLVLVSPADVAAREFGVVLWIGVVVGVLGSGLWGVVGAFGGIGLVNRTHSA